MKSSGFFMIFEIVWIKGFLVLEFNLEVKWIGKEWIRA
jgi:hypothetical protein